MGWLVLKTSSDGLLKVKLGIRGLCYICRVMHVSSDAVTCNIKGEDASKLITRTTFATLRILNITNIRFCIPCYIFNVRDKCPNVMLVQL